jgi:hypothetical protein
LNERRGANRTVGLVLLADNPCYREDRWWLNERRGANRTAGLVLLADNPCYCEDR